MLWLALHFASLPLEVYARAAHRSSAVAVADPAHTIVACNDTALKLGVKRGMAVAAASALVSDLNVVSRDITAEEAALERLAAWAIQFTPTVTIARPAEILLEIEGSLTIFKGLKHLWTEVIEGLRTLGFTASIACAPTPLAAQWFARARLAVRLRHADALRASLPELPVEVTHAPSEALAFLHDIGAHSIGDCLALPRDGLARRLDARFIDDLDRALGLTPDARLPFTPPTIFKAAQPLPAPAQEAEMLLFAARRLMNELCGFLTATANGVERLTFTFSHHKLAATKLTLSLLEATRDVEHLTNVLRERLDRTTLPEDVTAVALESELLLPLASRNLSLIPDPGQLKEAATHLVERLRARLGDEAVQGLTRYPDHRPERAWRACEPGTRDSTHALIAGRPLWLLERPLRLSEIGGVPHYDGRLSRLTRAERIESGWWDGHDVTRDYFIACNSAEALLWIYQERQAGGGWFLHGFFA
jgi:protein ImuB